MLLWCLEVVGIVIGMLEGRNDAVPSDSHGLDRFLDLVVADRHDHGAARMKVLRTASVQWSLIALTVMFAIDRLHKFLQVDLAGWRGGESVRVAPFLDYVMVWNPGISYGLLDWVPPEALLVVMAVAIAALIWWWRTSTAFWVRLGIALILGGALSNVVDRLVYGAVADFFHFYVGNFSWFVFNLADVAISLGVATLAIDALWREVKPGAEGPETPQGTE